MERILPWASAAFLIGIAMRAELGAADYAPAMLSASLLLAAAGFILRRTHIAAAALFLVLGGQMMAMRAEAEDARLKAWSGMGETAVFGTVVSLDERKGQRIAVMGDLIVNGKKMEGRIRAVVEARSKIKEGCLAGISGKPELSETAGKYAGYGRYLLSQNIYASIDRALTESAENCRGSARSFIRNTIRKNMNEPYAGIYTAALLGYQGDVAADLSSAFSRTGLSHLIAISGGHLALLSAAAAGVFRSRPPHYFPRPISPRSAFRQAARGRS